MKVPKAGMLCGWCGKPVIRHQQAVEEFVPDDRPGAPALGEGRPPPLRKQLYHKKRCWSKEMKQRLRMHRLGTREDKRLDRIDELQTEVLADKGLLGVVNQAEIDIATRKLGNDRPEIVSDDARLVTVGETPERDDLRLMFDCPACGTVHPADEHPEVVHVMEEKGIITPGTIVRGVPGQRQSYGVGRGELMAAVSIAIESRPGEWWTRRDIAKDVAGQGLTTTQESVDQTCYLYEKSHPLERRRAGIGHEFRVPGTVKPVPPPTPELQHEVDRSAAQWARQRAHAAEKRRPSGWEKEAVHAATQQFKGKYGEALPSDVAVEFVPYVTGPPPGYEPVDEPVPPPVVQATVTEPVVELVTGLVQAAVQSREETVMASDTVQQTRVGGMVVSNGRTKQQMELFSLKSEKMLNDLERTMTQLVQQAIQEARQQIAKLVEEELR